MHNEPQQQWHPPAHPVPAQPRNGFGVTALVLGIVGACLSLVPVVGVIAWPLVILGLIFGILGIRRVRKGAATNRGAAIAGVATSAVGLVLCFVWLFAFGASVNQYEQDMKQLETGASAPTPADVPMPKPAPAPEPPAPAADEPAPGSIPGDGTFLVGDDIDPGTYRTAGPDGYACYWARLASTTGELGSINANGIAQGSTVVTIKATDTAFKTKGCQVWELVK